MSDYEGFFVRDQLGQVPGGPGSGFSTSPDVILAGGTPPPDRGRYVTPAGYATDFGAPVRANQHNYVFLRALNTGPAAATGRAWLYWLESDLAPWPRNWRSDGIRVSGSAANYQEIRASAAGQVCIAQEPFIWTPPAGSEGPYSLVSWMENPPASSPPASPAAGLAPLATFAALAELALAHPNAGWRSTMAVGSLSATWSLTTRLTGPAEAPGAFSVGFQCSNMPTDALVGFTVPPPEPSGSGVSFPLTPIPNPNYQGTVRITDWPGGAASSVILNYRQGATTPSPGASITVTLTVPVSALSAATQQRLAAQPEAVKTLDVTEPGPGATQITPTRLALVGSQTYHW